MGEKPVVNTPAPVTTPATPAATPETTVTARSAVEAAFGRAEGASTTPGSGQPPAGVVTPPAPAGTPSNVAPPPAAGADAGIANLRNAYENLKRDTEWARSLSKDQVIAIMDRWNEMQRDPVAFYQQLGNELQAQPELASRLAPPKEDPEPGPDLYTMSNGERIEVYSAKQTKLWREWNQRQMDRRMDDRVSPLQAWVDRARESAIRNEITAESKQTASEVLTDLRQVPHFKEHEKLVAARLAAMSPRLKESIGTIAALHLAWSQVQRSHVFPSIHASAEKRVREDMERKAAAAAGTARTTSGGGQAGSTRPANQAQLAAKMAAGAYNQ